MNPLSGGAKRAEIVMAAGIASTYVWGSLAGWVTVVLLTCLGGWGFLRYMLRDARETQRLKREMKHDAR